MARRKQDVPHPPGAEIPMHTVEALTRIIHWIGQHADQFKAEVEDADACLALLTMVRNGRATTPDLFKRYVDK